MPNVVNVDILDSILIQYVQNHASTINNAASALGVSPTAIAGVMMEELRAQINKINDKAGFYGLPLGDKSDVVLDQNTLLKVVSSNLAPATNKYCNKINYIQNLEKFKSG